MNRLRQLELQRGGLNAFNNPDVQRQLNLTDQQQQQLRALNDQTTQQQQQILQGARTNRNQTLQRLNDLNRQTQEQTNAILNEQQRRTFQQMTGQPFNFPPNLPAAPNPPRP
jgi:Spy/CpxP family protein refolding chaperone